MRCWGFGTKSSEDAGRRGRRLLAAVAAGCAALVAGCQSLPERVDRQAADLGLERRVVAGETFRHVVYQRRAPRSGQALHVYLEGDGSPWLHGMLPAADPTPRRPYALELMAADPAPSVYLGRPCYFGLSGETPCDNRWWTSARYAPAVVDSMAAALESLLAERGGPPAVLVGYSGGGALAVLLASRVAGVQRVITVAANLDTARWTERHGYLPLRGSLNPMAAARLDGRAHVHFAGGADEVVASDTVRAFAARHHGRFRVVADFDHSCCWRRRWPELLAEALAPAAVAGQPGQGGSG